MMGNFSKLLGLYTANIIFKGEKLKAFPFDQVHGRAACCHHFLFNIFLEVLDIAIRQEKTVKGVQIANEVKLSLFVDDMITYIENQKIIVKKKNSLTLLNNTVK